MGDFKVVMTRVTDRQTDRRSSIAGSRGRWVGLSVHGVLVLETRLVALPQTLIHHLTTTSDTDI